MKIHPFLVLVTVVCATVDLRVEEWIEAQELIDEKNLEFVIDLNEMSESTPFGDFTLKTLIHRADRSLVYTIAENRNFLIKYECNCNPFNSFEPLVREFWFTNEVHNLGKGPKPYFLSPPIRLPRTPTSKLQFSMDNKTWKKCHRDGGTVRFLLIQRLPGITLQRYRFKDNPNGIEIVDAIPDLKALIRMTRMLHVEGIVHGDVHMDNVIVNGDHLTFIDYGRAFFAQPDQDNEPVYRYGKYTHELSTPWQIRGLPWGKRDDVFKVLDIFARMVQPDEYLDHIFELVDKGTDALLKFREEEFLLDKPHGIKSYSFNPLERMNVSEIVTVEIRQRFLGIMASVLALEDINTEPPYEYILDELGRIQDLLGRRDHNEESD